MISASAVKQRIVDDYTRASGRHDQASIYGGPPGDPGLCGPGSVSWELHSDLATLAVAGTAAIAMELLHPSVMAGVHDLSNYREAPFKRARNTLGYVLVTTFGSTEAAERLIGRVKRMHSRVVGVRPDGVPYEALDPALIGWVHTSIPYAVMRAFERYNRPLTPAERDRYLAEQAVIGRMGGAGEIPVTMAELDEYVEAMRPNLAITEQTRTFFEFLLASPLGPPLPERLVRPANLLGAHASMSLLPDWARRLVGFHHGALAQRAVVEPYLRVTTRTIRWAFGVPPFRAMADRRVASARRARPARSAVPAARGDG
jgi:uncharacterized protein (DUF2236 family)